MAPTSARQAFVAMADKSTTRRTAGLRARGDVARVLAAFVVVVAAVGYIVFVKSTRTDSGSLSALVIERTGVAALTVKPADSEFVSPKKSAFAAVKKAAASDPDETGGYGKEWRGSTASGDAATQLVELLPTSAEAKETRTEAEADYRDAAALKAAHTTVTAHFTVSGVPGAFGVRVATAKTSTSGATSGTVVVFQQGRVVAMTYLQSSSGGLGQADAAAMARDEQALLRRTGPGYSLTHTTRPVVLSVVYGLITLLAAGLILFVPGLVGRRRSRLQARRQEQARYEYRARGGKAMRRRRPPPWAQRARSAGSIR